MRSYLFLRFCCSLSSVMVMIWTESGFQATGKGRLGITKSLHSFRERGMAYKSVCASPVSSCAVLSVELIPLSA